MPPKPSQKYYFILAKYLNTIVLAITIIVLAALVYFLYNNFYLTLSEAKQLSSLQEKVVSENLQKGKFKQVIDDFHKKIGVGVVITTTTSSTATSTVSTTSSTTSTIASTTATSTQIKKSTSTTTSTANRNSTSTKTSSSPDKK